MMETPGFTSIGQKMAETHIVNTKLTTIDQNGNPIDKETAALNSLLNTTTISTIIREPTNPNTDGNPSIKTYLEREAADGFTLTLLNQNTIITTKTATISPSDIPDLSIWWKSSTGFTDNGTTASWIDSVSSYNATSTSGSRPTFIAGTDPLNINGKPALSFAQDFLQIGTSQPFLKNIPGHTIITVFRYKLTSDATGAVIDIVNRATIGHYTTGSDKYLAYTYRRLDSDSLTTITGPLLHPTIDTQVYKAIAISNYTSGSEQATFNVNGTTYTGTAPTPGLTSNTNTTLGIAFKDRSALRNFDGQIAEIIIYNRALSTSEITNLNDYINNEYGV